MLLRNHYTQGTVLSAVITKPFKIIKQKEKKAAAIWERVKPLLSSVCSVHHVGAEDTFSWRQNHLLSMQKMNRNSNPGTNIPML